MFYIQFVNTCSAFDKLMTLPNSLNQTKQRAIDIARNWYGESVLNVYDGNEINVEIETIPFGSSVVFQEFDKEGIIKRTINYPQGKFGIDEPFITCLNWFKKIDQLDDEEKVNRNISRQIACHLEETKEFLSSIREFDEPVIDESILALSKVEDIFKEDNYFNFKDMTKDKKIELLDSLCDMITTSIGIGYRLGFDILGAMNEVNRSNWSKFENGKVLKDITGKVIKGRNYSEPELEQFIDKN